MEKSWTERIKMEGEENDAEERNRDFERSSHKLHREEKET